MNSLSYLVGLKGKSTLLQGRRGGLLAFITMFSRYQHNNFYPSIWHALICSSLCVLASRLFNFLSCHRKYYWCIFTNMDPSGPVWPHTRFHVIVKSCNALQGAFTFHNCSNNARRWMIAQVRKRKARSQMILGGIFCCEEMIKLSTISGASQI